MGIAVIYTTEDGNDFKLVLSRRKRKILRKSNIEPTDDSTLLDQCEVLRKIDLATDEIKNSDFYSTFDTVLQNALTLLGRKDIREIVCYGLGHFADCIISRYQLGLLLFLKQKFGSKVFVYDPVFTPTECELLQQLNCELISENEEGKWKLVEGVTTLVFLPHCPKQLTNNFLWSNWGPQIKECILLCNSFSSILEKHPHHTLHSSLAYIINIFQYTEELPIDNCFKYQDIFNDLSLHFFPCKNISTDNNLWVVKDIPIYPPDDIEFITRKVQACSFDQQTKNG